MLQAVTLIVSLVLSGRSRVQREGILLETFILGYRRCGGRFERMPKLRVLVLQLYSWFYEEERVMLRVKPRPEKVGLVV